MSTITKEELEEMSNLVKACAEKAQKEVFSIIEGELKQVSLFYDIDPKNLILQVYPDHQYVIAIKICGFSIENKVTINNE